jgi:hypothetical protein
VSVGRPTGRGTVPPKASAKVKDPTKPVATTAGF